MAITSRECPTCATQIPSGFPAGMCPACMLTGIAAKEPARELAEEPLQEKTVETSPVPPQKENATPRLPAAPGNESVKGAFLQFERVERLKEGPGYATYRGQLRFDARYLTLQLISISDEVGFNQQEEPLQKVIDSRIPGWPGFEEYGWIEIDSRPYCFLLSHPDETPLLEEFLREEKPSPDRILSIFRKLGELLAPLHAEGKAHHAITPECVRISADDSVRFSDLGMGERSAILLGKSPDLSSPYLAPECWDNPSGGDSGSDIFSLGTVIYETITGSLPGDSLVPLADFLPEEWHNIVPFVFRMMERNPDKRPGIYEVVERLTQTAAEPKPIPVSSSHRPYPYLVWILAGLCITGLLIWAFV